MRDKWETSNRKGCQRPKESSRRFQGKSHARKHPRSAQSQSRGKYQSVDRKISRSQEEPRPGDHQIKYAEKVTGFTIGDDVTGGDPSGVQAEGKNQTTIEVDDGELSAEESEEGFISCEEVELVVHIPENDMLWLERSVEVYFNTVGKLNVVIISIKKQELQVQAREISNVMLLLTVENENSIEECVKMVKDFKFDFISDVVLWESSSMMRRSSFWVILEDVPLDLWHENFFAALSNDWGRFIKVDDRTARRESFKFARLQLLISSLSDIPRLVVGKFPWCQN
ncbi:hypothetical protein COLO4_32986 [Corchorus olitorius]|uniref:Uncharacterized protein n=1 Tax=Corchorus olitorius TaxID=93759 RepID=A0A1R3GX83_9ROSI|nr:hypothetical protein COLO4_32986 [Corchorus olitorius]